MTNLRLGMSLEIMTTLGAIAGGITAVLVSGRAPRRAVFAGVLVYVAYAMNRRGGDVAAERTGVLEADLRRPRRRAARRLRRAPLQARRLPQPLRRQHLRPRRPRRRRLQGADHERRHGRAAQGDDRDQQPHDRRDRGDRRGRSSTAAATSTRATRCPRPSASCSGPASVRASPCACGRRTLERHLPGPAVVFAVLMARAARWRGVRAMARPSATSWTRSRRSSTGSCSSGCSSAWRSWRLGIAARARAGRPACPTASSRRPTCRERWLDGEAAAFLTLGLLVLIVTPFLRVAGSLVAFALERDRRYVLISAAVLTLMCLSVLLGRA